jgi:hypothetical protein
MFGFPACFRNPKTADFSESHADVSKRQATADSARTIVLTGMALQHRGDVRQT